VCLSEFIKDYEVFNMKLNNLAGESGSTRPDEQVLLSKGMEKQKKIAITGAGGLIGMALSDEFRNIGY